MLLAPPIEINGISQNVLICPASLLGDLVKFAQKRPHMTLTLLSSYGVRKVYPINSILGGQYGKRTNHR